MGDSEIPFPLISGQYIAYTTGFDQSGMPIRDYYMITKQPTFLDLTYKYEIGAGQSLTDETITLGTGSGAISVFKTPYLKQWVTWIDNDSLGVQWTIVNSKMNTLNGFNEPMTIYTNPFGNINFPMFSFQNESGDVTFTLKNTSSSQTIAGTLHVIMYDYVISNKLPEGQTPQYFTDITYRGTGGN